MTLPALHPGSLPLYPHSHALQVKAWAAQAGVIGAADGKFSSHALALMCVWHLQMRQPAVLPPLGALFGWRERPAEGGTVPHLKVLQVRNAWVHTHAAQL